jgi:general stress protein 26
MAIGLLAHLPMADEKLEKLHDLIDDIETAMFTTRRADGRLVSRPMATQKRASGADLWFVTMRGQLGEPERVEAR